MSAASTTLVSVDLDDLDCYHAVHGVDEPARALALTRWLPRFLRLFEALGVRATFFVIGSDVRRDLDAGGHGAAVLREAIAAGHELASHSYAHAYDLSCNAEHVIADDLRRADDVLRELGADPCGFRAPGYTQSPAMMRAVAALGYRYDSSVLPSPPYYAVKLAMMAAMKLRGRHSSSLASGVRSFLGEAHPYRRRDAPLVELPMSVTPWLRLPIIGTTLLSTPRMLRGHLRAAALRADYFHLELHAIDLADAHEDRIDAELPELRRPLETRIEALREVLTARGPTTTLATAAAGL